MIRWAALLLLAVLPAAALAQADDGALRPADAPRDQTAPEPLSQAQVAQMIADRGYFEMRDLMLQPDGRWTCTALVEPGRRVALTVDRDGTIWRKDLPRDDSR